MASGDVVRAYLGCSADVFTFLGVACSAYLSYIVLSSICHGIKAYFLARSLGLSTKLQRFGQWAVVTGSTDGIGKAYAEQLAQLGINIVLISRSRDKLENVAKEIESKFKVKTKTVVADFTRGTSIYAGIRSELEGLEIGVLVNNVGMSYQMPGRLLDFENREKLFMDLIHVNITSMTMMTNMVLPWMVDRGKGVVINISSMAGTRPLPMLTIYSAVKAYANFFSNCLDAEYSHKGIISQSVLPGFVATNMSRIKQASVMVPSPTTFVRSALATVGVQSETYGYWAHAIMAFFMWCMPRFLLNKITLHQMQINRDKFLRKQQREAKAQ